jgi:hypothetical protein
VNAILYQAPPLVNQMGDGAHPVEYRWVFDPPLALPQRGHYFFDIMADWFGVFEIPSRTSNPYPDGGAWETSPVSNCSQPSWPYGDSPPKVDLAFEIQFCGAGPVGVGRECISFDWRRPVDG